MPATSNDIANQALLFMGGDMPTVAGQNPTFDQSAAGIALSKLYGPCVATVQRQFGWDASRNAFTLAASGNAGPFPLGYLHEYLYPSNGIELWQLYATPADVNNPLPINWDVGNTLVSSVQTKVIWTNLAAAVAIYNNNPNESTWDSGFRETVVRLLASELAMALAGKPDTMQQLLESSGAFAQVGESRPD